MRPSAATELHVLRVFADASGAHGNPLGVYIDGTTVVDAERQGVAADLGFSETVFIEDASTGRFRIFTPAAELPFAGHPTVGTAWLLHHLGRRVATVHPPAGVVPTWIEGALRWIRARASWVHPIHVEQLPDAAAVDAVDASSSGDGSYYPWAWIDETAGIVRSRYFVPSLGIGEDEATGAAAVVMGDLLGRPIEIHQGRGSVLHVRPGPDGTVDVGGRCILDEVRAHGRPWHAGRSE